MLAMMKPPKDVQDAIENAMESVGASFGDIPRVNPNPFIIMVRADPEGMHRRLAREMRHIESSDPDSIRRTEDLYDAIMDWHKSPESSASRKKLAQNPPAVPIWD